MIALNYWVINNDFNIFAFYILFHMDLPFFWDSSLCSSLTLVSIDWKFYEHTGCSANCIFWPRNTSDLSFDWWEARSGNYQIWGQWGMPCYTLKVNAEFGGPCYLPSMLGLEGPVIYHQKAISFTRDISLLENQNWGERTQSTEHNLLLRICGIDSSSWSHDPHIPNVLGLWKETLKAESWFIVDHKQRVRRCFGFFPFWGLLNLNMSLHSSKSCHNSNLAFT